MLSSSISFKKVIVIYSTVVKNIFLSSEVHDVCRKQFCIKHMSDFISHFLYRGRKNKHAAFPPSPLPKNCSYFVSCPQLSKASRRGFSRIRNNPQYERAITIIQTRTGKRFLSYTVCPISWVPSQPVRSSQLSATTITFEYHPLEGKVRIVFSCLGNKKLLTFDA